MVVTLSAALVPLDPDWIGMVAGDLLRRGSERDHQNELSSYCAYRIGLHKRRRGPAVRVGLTVRASTSRQHLL